MMQEVGEYLKIFLNYYIIINNINIDIEKFIKNYIIFSTTSKHNTYKSVNYKFIKNPYYDTDISIYFWYDNIGFCIDTIAYDIENISKYNKNNNIMLYKSSNKKKIFNKNKQIIFWFYNNILYKIYNLKTDIIKKYDKFKNIIKKKQLLKKIYKYFYINFYIYIYIYNKNNCKYDYLNYNFKNYNIIL